MICEHTYDQLDNKRFQPVYGDDEIRRKKKAIGINGNAVIPKVHMLKVKNNMLKLYGKDKKLIIKFHFFNNQVLEIDHVFGEIKIK